jgi:hypothetical protein
MPPPPKGLAQKSYKKNSFCTLKASTNRCSLSSTKAREGPSIYFHFIKGKLYREKKIKGLEYGGKRKKIMKRKI